MRGLMTEHGMKPDDFLDFVHEIDYSPLEPNPALGAAIERCPAASSSSPMAPASMPTRCCGGSASTGHFEDVFDIVAAELEPKPSPPLRALPRRTASIRHGGDVRGPRAQSSLSPTRSA